MLCEGLVQARDEYILTKTNIEPIYYYLIDAPESMGNTQNTNKRDR